MPDPVETFANQIEKVEKSLFNDLGRITKQLATLSDTELVNVMRELNFLEELSDRGYVTAVDGLMESYEAQLGSIMKEASKRGIQNIGGATIEQLELLQELDTKILLGNARVFADTLKEGLFSGIVSGEAPSGIVARLKDTVNLRTHQLNVAVHDGFRRFDDIARYKVFKGEDVMWTYVGPEDDRTRPECSATISNRKNSTKGYTELEVLGSDTPFGERGGFNCRHSWMVL